jgi:hypothetical protein
VSNIPWKTFRRTHNGMGPMLRFWKYFRKELAIPKIHQFIQKINIALKKLLIFYTKYESVKKAEKCDYQ